MDIWSKFMAKTKSASAAAGTATTNDDIGIDTASQDQDHHPANNNNTGVDISSSSTSASGGIMSSNPASPMMHRHHQHQHHSQRLPSSSSSSPSSTSCALHAVIITQRPGHTDTTTNNDNDAAAVGGVGGGNSAGSVIKKKMKVVRILVNNQHVPPPPPIISSNTSMETTMSTKDEYGGLPMQQHSRSNDGEEQQNEYDDEYEVEEEVDKYGITKEERRRRRRRDDGMMHEDSRQYSYVDDEEQQLDDNEEDNEGDDDEEGFDEEADIEEEQEDEEGEVVDRAFSRDNSSSSDTAAAGGASSDAMKRGRGNTGEGKNTDFEASLLLNIGTSAGESNISTSTTTTTANTNPPLIEKEEQQRLLRERGTSASETIHDPTTLPTSMTSFLDILTEEQRRVRHRHIPTVDGFRKLYKSEIKSDITLARRSCRKRQLQQQLQLQQRRSSNNSKSSSEDNVDGSTTPMDVEDHVHESEGMHDTMVVDEEEGIVDDNNEDGDENPSETTLHEDNITEDSSSNNVNLKNKDVSDAFIVPTREARQCALGGQLANLLESTDFENAIGNASTSSKKLKASAVAAAASLSTASTTSGPLMLARSPKLVDSLTTFNPPRPQESTTAKTLHRMKRWEANPSEIEVDLRNYRKTVCRTKEELHIAEEERVRVESVASFMRNHFMEHLKSYRAEMLAINEGLVKTNARCCKLLDDEKLQMRNSTVTTRGGAGGSGGSGKGMEDVLATLKTLGKKGVGSDVEQKGEAPTDWRIKGVGGVCADASGAGGREERTAMMAKGWLLVGDEVIVSSTGDEGIVVSIDGMTMKSDASSGVEAKVKKEDKKENEPAVSSSSPKDADTMDVDTPLNTGKENAGASMTKTEGATKSSSTKPDSLVKAPSIGVKLTKSGNVQTCTLAEIEFHPDKISSTLLNLSDSALARRWECMVNTALANCAGHDILAMDEYINSSFIGESTHADDGTASPKSVTLYKDEHTLLPFGSGIVAAPDDVKNGPSVIPLDNLEETVRKAVYGTDTPRVIPTMPSTIRPYESRKEEMNALKGKVLQLRNRLGRQKRLRSLNEQSLVTGKSRAKKVERLLHEMEKDLKTLKGRLQDELNELGIGNTATNAAVDATEGVATTVGDDEGAPIRGEGMSDIGE